MEQEIGSIKTQDVSFIKLPATPVLWLVIIFTTLIIAGLIALSISLYQSNSQLRIDKAIAQEQVNLEETKLATFLATQELIIEKYWLEKLSEYGQIVGSGLIEANSALLGSLSDDNKKKE